MPKMNTDYTNKCGSCKFAKSAYFQPPMGDKSYVYCSYNTNRSSELQKVKQKSRPKCTHYEMVDGYKFVPKIYD